MDISAIKKNFIWNEKSLEGINGYFCISLKKPSF